MLWLSYYFSEYIFPCEIIQQKKMKVFSECAADHHISFQKGCPSLCCHQGQMKAPTEKSQLCGFPFLKKDISPYKNQSLCMTYKIM